MKTKKVNLQHLTSTDTSQGEALDRVARLVDKHLLYPFLDPGFQIFGQLAPPALPRRACKR